MSSSGSSVPAVPRARLSDDESEPEEVLSDHMLPMSSDTESDPEEAEIESSEEEETSDRVVLGFPATRVAPPSPAAPEVPAAPSAPAVPAAPDVPTAPIAPVIPAGPAVARYAPVAGPRVPGYPRGPYQENGVGPVLLRTARKRVFSATRIRFRMPADEASLWGDHPDLPPSPSSSSNSDDEQD